VRVEYLHSEVLTLERVRILRDLRKGEFDVLVGVNLLREGLDLPEVSLVAILDADKEGFLRAERSLVQTIGRAARNEHGKVIMFADKVTASMKAAIEETERRRAKQRAYNEAHGITPQTVRRQIKDLRQMAGFRSELSSVGDDGEIEIDGTTYTQEEVPKLIADLKKQMLAAAKDLDFERAAELRDQIHAVEDASLGLQGGSIPSVSGQRRKKASKRRGGPRSGRRRP